MGNGSGLHETILRLIDTGDTIKINEVCSNLKEEDAIVVVISILLYDLKKVFNSALKV